MSRLLLFCADSKTPDRQLAALKFLEIGAGAVHPSLGPQGTGMLAREAQHAAETLEKETNDSAYFAELSSVAGLVVASIDDDEWTDQIAAELVAQIRKISNDDKWKQRAVHYILSRVSPLVADAEFAEPDSSSVEAIAQVAK